MSHWKHRKNIINTKSLSILGETKLEYLNEPFLYLNPREQLMSVKAKSISSLFFINFLGLRNSK